MKLYALAFASLLILLATPLEAQTATVTYDAPAGVTAAQANQWTAVLYVNAVCTPTVCTGGTAFPSPHTCMAGVGAVVNCAFVIPTATFLAALTTSGPQNFSVALKDAVLGEGPQTAPFIRVKPGVATNPKLQ